MQTHDASGGHSDIWIHIELLRKDLGRTQERIAALEERLHDHEQAVPHAPEVTR